jgi:hypothetical protein
MIGRMRAGRSLWGFALMLGVGCAGSASDRGARPEPAAPPAQPAPAPTATSPALAAPERSPVTAADLPPQKQVQGEGIAITQLVDGSVHLKTTTQWNEALDTTYQSCDYYRSAIPVLRRQLTAERAKLLDQVCVEPKAKPKAK